MSEVPGVEEVSREERKSMRRIAAAAFVGTTIEWYDYFIFGTAAALVFGEVFFPVLSPTGGTLASLGIFAVAFVVRPVGAAFFGQYGDRMGRKKVLIVSMMLMASGTFLIGLLPPPSVIGIGAPILLVVLRMCQGLGVSGEWAGAVLIAVEHAPQRSRAFYGSFPLMGTSAGVLLATGAFALVGLLPEEQLISWGWRVPFLASALLAAVALYIRLRIAETPVFEEAQRRRDTEASGITIVELLRYHWRRVVLGVGFRLSTDVQGYVVSTFAVGYIVNQVGMSASLGTVAVSVAAGVALITAPLFGMLADRIGRKPVYAGGVALGIVLAFPFWWLLNTGSIALIILAVVLVYAFSASSSGALQGTMMSELFPTRLRYTGTSFTYHVQGVIGGGPAPFIAGALVAWSGGAVWPVGLYLTVVGVISLTATLLTREGSRSSLYDGPATREPEGVDAERASVSD